MKRRLQTQLKDISGKMENKIITEYLIEHGKNILDKLQTEKHFADYLFIQKKFQDHSIDYEFKKRFCHFYRLSGPMGMNGLQQDRFFSILSSKENDLEKFLKNLYEIPGYGNRHTLFLSFGTKLLHTLDETLPIYDGNVAYVLGLVKQNPIGTLEDKVRNRVAIYKELKLRFSELLTDKTIVEYLKNAKKESGLENESITNTKLLDSILWALYSLIHTEPEL